MSNNYWNQQPENNNGSHTNGSPRSGSLIRNYSDQTVQAPPQYSPLMGQIPQGAPPSQYSPVPPVTSTAGVAIASGMANTYIFWKRYTDSTAVDW